MNTSRKIQIAIGTMLLWVSTAASGLAATQMNSGKFQSDTVKVSGDSLPVRSLTPDTHLIAQNYGDQISRRAQQMDDNGYIPKWEEALKQPNAEQIILAFCPSQPQDKVEDCWRLLRLWSLGQIVKAREAQIASQIAREAMESRNIDFDLVDTDLVDTLDSINNAARDAVLNLINK